MRIGKRMKQIINVLSESDEPLTLTDIIVNIIGKPQEEKCCQVASALIDSPIDYEAQCFTRIKGKKRDYHPVDYARILYANYSRALTTLIKNGIVRPLDYYEYTYGRLFDTNPDLRCVASKNYHGRYVLNVKKKILNVNEVEG